MQCGNEQVLKRHFPGIPVFFMQKFDLTGLNQIKMWIFRRDWPEMHPTSNWPAMPAQ